jgi:alcohol dehydrogenase (cytochrome c)
MPIASEGRTYAAVAIAAGLAGILAAPASAAPVTYERLLNVEQEPSNWLHHHRTYDGHRFSPLTQINKTTVKDLELRIMVGLDGIIGPDGATRLEGTPLAEDGFLYVTDGFNNAYKIDVRSGTAGYIVWKWDPGMDRAYAFASGCCQRKNRGLAMAGDLVIQSTQDGRMVGINKDSGEAVWEAKTADNELMESHTGAPLVYKNLAINGVTGAEMGIRGHLDAVNVETGEIVWTRPIIPGPGEPGHETWGDGYDAWMTGGGSIWQTGTFDPETNLTYWGTGNPGPQIDAEYRPGDNLYTESIIALNADTGEIAWHFQFTPNDPYDFDDVAESPLIDVNIDGEERKAVVHVSRNGHFYGFDRLNGEFLYGKQYVDLVNWTDGIDQKTGRPTNYVAGMQDQVQPYFYAPRRGVVGIYCPALTGGKNWQPVTYSRQTGLLYAPSNEGCSAYKARAEEHWADKGNKLGTRANRTPGEWNGRENATPEEIEAAGGFPVEQHGSVVAMNPATGETVLKVNEPLRGNGLLSTAGGLVISTDLRGYITAYDAETLETLWSRDVGTGINAPAMTYSYGGTQYLAVLAGGNTNVAGDPRLANRTSQSLLLVFAR